MSHLFLWIPWLVVAAMVAAMLFNRRGQLRPAYIAIEVAIVVVGYAAYYVVRGLTEGAEATAIANALTIVDIERWLHVYWEPDMQEFVLQYERMTVLSNWLYIWWHWPVIIVAAVWLFVFKPQSYGVYRDAFLLSGVVGLAFFAAMPVAPPRIADPQIIDTIAVHSGAYRTYEAPAFVNQFAAFPSLHFGWNLLVSVALIIESGRRSLRIIGVISPIVVLLAIVVTGNHFIIDAIAGGALAVASLFVARRYRLLPSPVTHYRAPPDPR